MRFLRSVIHTFLNRASVAVLGVLASVLTARLVAPEHYGALVSVVAGMGIIVRFGSLGLVQSFQHFGSKSCLKDNEYIIPLVLALMVPSLLVVGFTFVSLWLLNYFSLFDAGFKFVFSELRYGLLFMMMHLCFSMYFLGKDDAKRYFIICVVPVLATVGCVVAAHFFSNPFNLILIGWELQLIGGGILGLAFVVYEVGKQQSWPSSIREKVFEVTNYGLKSVLVSSISFSLMRASIVIGSIFSLADVAVFAVARSFCEVLSLAYGALGSTLFSAVSRTPVSNHSVNLYCQSARISMFSLILISLIIAATAHKAVPLLFGLNYLPSVDVVYVLLVGVLISTQQRLAENFLFGVSSQAIILWYQLPNLILLSSLVWWLTPLYGAVGIALSSVMSSVFSYAAVSYLICSKYQISLKDFTLLTKQDMKDLNYKLVQIKVAVLRHRRNGDGLY